MITNKYTIIVNLIKSWDISKACRSEYFMKDKFTMTREQNIFLAKRNIVDYIYKSANLEGINVTFPETQAIFDGVGVEGVKVDDIIKINNLKRAWQFMIDTLDRLTDFD